MAKKKHGPEKVEPKSSDSPEVSAPSEIEKVEVASNEEADLANHPKFAKFKSHGGKLND